MNVFLHADDHAHPRVVECVRLVRQNGASVIFGFGYECGQACLAIPRELELLARCGRPFGEAHTRFRWGEPSQCEALRAALQAMSVFLSIETRSSRFEFSGSANEPERVEAIRLAGEGRLRLLHVGRACAGSESGVGLLAHSTNIAIEELVGSLGLRT